MEKEEIDKIIQENIILKADNLLFREDLIHLSETNKMYKTVIIDNSLNKHCKYDNVYK